MAELPVGRAARGKAGVFGSSINPLSLYLQYSGQRERNKAAVAAQQRAERDKAMDYLDKFSPNSKFDIFNRDVNEQATGVREWYIQQKQAGISDYEIYPQLKQKQGQILAYAQEADGWKKTIDELETKVNNDPIRYKVDGPDTLKSLLRNIYLNADGSKKEDINEIREGFNNANSLLHDPRVLNKEGVIKSWTEKLPEQSRVLLTNAYSAMGYSQDQIENIVKSGLTYEMEQDPQTKEMRPKLDDDLMPKVVIDEKTYRLAKADIDMLSLMTAASSTKNGQMEWLKQNVRGAGDKLSQDRQVISGKKLGDDQRYSFGGYGFKTPIADLQDRDKMLTQISLGGPTGGTLLGYFDDPMSEIKASYSDVAKVDGKTKKGQFVKVDYTTSAINLPEVSDEDYNKMSFAERKRYDESMKNRKVVKSNYYDITTQDGRDKLKVALSAEMDRMNKTKAIAEDYPRFIEASRTAKNRAKAPTKKGDRPNFDNAGQ